MEESLRTSRKFRQLVHNGPPELVEVVAPGMGMSDLLAQQSPEFLDGTEPRGIGGQGKHYQSGVLLHCLEHYGMPMVGPVVPDQVDSFGLRISTRDLANILGETPYGNPGTVPGQDLAGRSIQEAHQAHQGVGAMAVTHLGLLTTQAGPQPALAGLSVETGLVLEEQDSVFRILLSFLQGLHQSPLFGVYWGSGL